MSCTKNINRKLSYEKEAHEILESNFDGSELCQIENMILDDTKEKLQ